MTANTKQAQLEVVLAEIMEIPTKRGLHPLETEIFQSVC